MKDWQAWATAVDFFFKMALVMVAALFVRNKVDELGREALNKSLSQLRDQIKDRDMLSIGQREQIETLTGRVKNLEAEMERKESQILALLSENITLKKELPKRPPP